MSILFVTGSLVHGGAERHTITLLNRLAERGHECHAAYVKDDPGQLGRLRRRGERRLPAARRVSGSQGHPDGWAPSLSRIRPSAVVAANPYAMLYARLALRLSGVEAPSDGDLPHHAPRATPRNGCRCCITGRFSGPPTAWCSCARRSAATGCAGWSPAARNRVIYNGVDPEHWRSPGPEARTRMRRVLGLADGDYVVGMCAVFRPEKNHLQLVEAIAKLRARGIPARALLIGDGPMRAGDRGARARRSASPATC